MIKRTGTMLSLRRIALKSCHSCYSFRTPTRYFHYFAARPPPRGTGFDNFLKDHGKGSKKDASDSSSRGSGQNNENDGRNNGNRNDKDNSLLWFAAAVAALGMANYVSSRSSEEEDVAGGAASGRTSAGSDAAHLHARGEITWGEFLRLLQQQDIVKILIDGNTERPVARVYIRENAAGLRQYEKRRRSALEHDLMVDDIAMDSSSAGDIPMGDETGVSTDSRSGNGRALSSSALHVTPLFYRLPIGSIESFERKLEDAQRALDRDPNKDIPVQYTADATLGREALAIVPGLFLAGLLYAMLRFSAGGGMGIPGRGGGGGGMGGIFQIGKSTHKKINKEDVAVRFSDVAGCDEAKKEIMEFVDFLKDSDRFTKLGAKIPKGALLCGPPGTGKTLLAKAVAGEADVPFYSISGTFCSPRCPFACLL
jgi:hypothetical protein